MDRSQLRKLAEAFATGKISEPEYRQQRAMLIDGIVEGRIAIERQPDPTPPPPPPKPTVSASEPTIRIAPAPPPKGPAPAYVVIGIALVALLIWALLPGKDEPPTPRPEPVTSRAAASPSRAQMLVEGYLAKRDWSEAATSRFQSQWDVLPAGDRKQIRAHPAYRRLTTALREEINTQKALMALDDTGPANNAAIRLVELASNLGINTGDASAALQSPAVAQTPAVADLPPPAARLEPATLPPLPAPAEASPSLSSNRWLLAQNDAHFTVQLFAVNQLTKIESIISSQPELDLKVIEMARQPRYRVLYGVFESGDEARAALHRLPPAILRQAPEPLVKPLKGLQDGIGTGGANDSAMLVPPSGPAARHTSDQYTLQLFALSSVENVEQLLQRYPNLSLSVHRSPTVPPILRVLHGRFDSSEEARQAFFKLPEPIVDEARRPIVKLLSDVDGMAVESSSPGANR